MATSQILLPIAAAVLPDNSTGIANAPAIIRVKATGSTTQFFLTAQFAFDQSEYLWWAFRMPANYISGPIVKLLWYAAATSGNVFWSAQIAATTPTDADTPVEHAAAAVSSQTTSVNGTEAGRLVETSITLANLDGLAAGDLVLLGVLREGSNVSDTLNANDAILVAVSLDYTS